MAYYTNTSLPTRIADTFNRLYSLSVKLHKTSANIGFVKKCLHLNVLPNFAELHGQFINQDDKHYAERGLLASHVKKHIDTYKELIIQHRKASEDLTFITGPLLLNFLYHKIILCSKKIRYSSFQTKNSKLLRLQKSTQQKKRILYDIPVINLSSTQLTEKELTQLSFNLDHSFVDKNKYVKKNLAANLELLTQSVDKNVSHDQKEEFHEFLHAYCDIFTKNIYSSKDFVYSNLKRLIKDKTMVVVPGDKDLCVIVMNKNDYVKKMKNMIDEGVTKGVYKKSEDNTLTDLKRFQDFVYRNFKKYKHYEKMCATSNTPAQLYGTAKTQKFNDISEITVDSLKINSVINQFNSSLHVRRAKEGVHLS